ncbi:hypothetical protein G7K_2269-t1 [Saitoella complicata NRRL Y-17804]|uniref:Uncharacterized protein n=1 Tax=Saitoella complicata (strain BCRC 22490 / CBS 7301 / JCM 7358 / NBRC 10748 / NRRL Y-17804) TaxID=698492 RepID=A0A0E9NE03_SAICN|nr:hypothetical protein G7K_2269-t1 [Saitoella complicata NRRL Y-17804]
MCTWSATWTSIYCNTSRRNRLRSLYLHHQIINLRISRFSKLRPEPLDVAPRRPPFQVKRVNGACVPRPEPILTYTAHSTHEAFPSHITALPPYKQHPSPCRRSTETRFTSSMDGEQSQTRMNATQVIKATVMTATQSDAKRPALPNNGVRVSA